MGVLFFVRNVFVVFVFEITLPKTIVKIEDMIVLKCICQKLSVSSPHFKIKGGQMFKHGMCSRYI